MRGVLIQSSQLQKVQLGAQQAMKRLVDSRVSGLDMLRERIRKFKETSLPSTMPSSSRYRTRGGGDDNLTYQGEDATPTIPSLQTYAQRF